MVQTCRLCLERNSEEKLNNVFQCNLKHAEDSLVDVLFWVFSVEIDVTDPFSKDICSECVQLIEYILQVKNTFQKNQENLGNILQNQNCENLEPKLLHDTELEKVPKRQKSASPLNTTPTNSPSKSRYTSKNLYGNCSPRVRLSLSTIEAMCPMSINIVPFERSQEYLRYKPIRDGSFKKRKYRHFKLDDRLLDDICSTLEDPKCDKFKLLTKEIGVSTEYSLLTKGVNTDEVNLCTCEKKITLPLKVVVPDEDLLSSNRSKREENTSDHDDNFMDIIGLTKNLCSDFTSPEFDNDWTKLTFKRDACTNTENNPPSSKSIGITANVHTVSNGTLAKPFRQTKKENVVEVNIKSLRSFGPTVVLQPLDGILKMENYQQIDEFSYIKRNDVSSKSESEEDSEKYIQQNDLGANQYSNTVEEERSKKQKFLDYYKNFSSFAVRELITGKKIRESDNGANPIFKVSNVCNVFVCDYCSKSFFSQISLDLHCRRAHKIVKKSDDIIEVIDLVDNKASIKPNIFRRRIKKRQTEPLSKPRSNSKSETGEKGHYENENINVKPNIETHEAYLESKESTSQINSTNNDNVLTRKSQKVNYNINDVMKPKIKVKQIPDRAKGRMRRKKKFKHLGNVVLVNKNRKNISYVWDRKGLGKYSAISYYRNYSGDEKASVYDLANCDIAPKTDIALNETIQKLATRLDSPVNSDQKQQS